MIEKGDVIEVRRDVDLRPRASLSKGTRGEVLRTDRNSIIDIEFEEHGRVILFREDIRKVPALILKVERAEKERKKRMLERILERGRNIWR